MDLRHLRVAIVLAEELHFGRAAARLRCVQSAVSVALKALAEELGSALFARSRRAVALTPAGEAFVRNARRALDSVAQAGAAARAAANGEEGRLSLRFTLTLHVTDEPLLALLPAHHPLARRRVLRMEELATEPRIMLSRFEEPHIFGAYAAASLRNGIEPRVVLEVDQIESVLAFVASGLGIAHAPASVRKLGMKGVVGIPVRPRIPSGITAVWNEATLTATGRNFLALLRQRLATE